MIGDGRGRDNSEITNWIKENGTEISKANTAALLLMIHSQADLAEIKRFIKWSWIDERKGDEYAETSHIFNRSPCLQRSGSASKHL